MWVERLFSTAARFIDRVVASVLIQIESVSVIVLVRRSLLAEGQCNFLTSLIASDTRRTLRGADGSRTSTAVNIPLAAGIPPAGFIEDVES